MKRTRLFIFLLVAFLLSSCVSNISKIQISGIKQIHLVSSSLESSSIMVSLAVTNNMKKSINVLDAEVVSKDIENLSVKLSEPIAVNCGINIIDVPLTIHYSIGSALILLGKIQNGTLDAYSLQFKLRLSKGGKGRPISFGFRKELSEEEIKSLLNKIIQ